MQHQHTHSHGIGIQASMPHHQASTAMQCNGDQWAEAAVANVPCQQHVQQVIQQQDQEEQQRQEDQEQQHQEGRQLPSQCVSSSGAITCQPAPSSQQQPQPRHDAAAAEGTIPHCNGSGDETRHSHLQDQASGPAVSPASLSPHTDSAGQPLFANVGRHNLLLVEGAAGAPHPVHPQAFQGFNTAIWGQLPGDANIPGANLDLSFVQPAQSRRLSSGGRPVTPSLFISAPTAAAQAGVAAAGAAAAASHSMVPTVPIQAAAGPSGTSAGAGEVVWPVKDDGSAAMDVDDMGAEGVTAHLAAPASLQLPLEAAAVVGAGLASSAPATPHVATTSSSMPAAAITTGNGSTAVLHTIAGTTSMGASAAAASSSAAVTASPAPGYHALSGSLLESLGIGPVHSATATARVERSGSLLERLGIPTLYPVGSGSLRLPSPAAAAAAAVAAVPEAPAAGAAAAAAVAAVPEAPAAGAAAAVEVAAPVEVAAAAPPVVPSPARKPGRPKGSKTSEEKRRKSSLAPTPASLGDVGPASGEDVTQKAALDGPQVVPLLPPQPRHTVHPPPASSQQQQTGADGAGLAPAHGVAASSGMRTLRAHAPGASKKISEAAPQAAKVELVALGANRNRSKAPLSLKSRQPMKPTDSSIPSPLSPHPARAVAGLEQQTAVAAGSAEAVTQAAGVQRPSMFLVGQEQLPPQAAAAYGTMHDVGQAAVAELLHGAMHAVARSRERSLDQEHESGAHAAMQLGALHDEVQLDAAVSVRHSPQQLPPAGQQAEGADVSVAAAGGSRHAEQRPGALSADRLAGDATTLATAARLGRSGSEAEADAELAGVPGPTASVPVHGPAHMQPPLPMSTRGVAETHPERGLTVSVLPHSRPSSLQLPSTEARASTQPCSPLPSPTALSPRRASPFPQQLPPPQSSTIEQAGQAQGHPAPKAAAPQAGPQVTISSTELPGVACLAACLQHWLSDSPHGAFIDELPFSVKDPAFLLEQLEEAMQLLLQQQQQRSQAERQQLEKQQQQQHDSVLPVVAEDSVPRAGSLSAAEGEAAAVPAAVAGRSSSPYKVAHTESRGQAEQPPGDVVMQDVHAAAQPGVTGLVTAEQQRASQHEPDSSLAEQQQQRTQPAAKVAAISALQESLPWLLSMSLGVRKRPYASLAPLDSLPHAWQAMAAAAGKDAPLGMSPCPTDLIGGSVLAGPGGDLNTMEETGETEPQEEAAGGGLGGGGFRNTPARRPPAGGGTGRPWGKGRPTTDLGMVGSQGLGAGRAMVHGDYGGPGPKGHGGGAHAHQPSSKKVAKIKKGLGL